MKEQIVEFNTSKLAKEKRFDEPCNEYYYKDTLNKKWKTTHPQTPFNKWYTKKEILAPTQSLLQKWLREKHNIDIEPRMSYTRKKYFLVIFKNSLPIHTKSDVYYKTYEKALEKGLYQALKLIK